MSDRGRRGKSGSSGSSNRMWGGRFEGSASGLMESFNASIDVDRRLYREDIEGSLAHAAMLSATGILSGSDHRRISRGLRRIEREIDRGEFAFSAALEDVHMNVESRLSDLIGSSAGRLHTARSRNDQIATDSRLYVRRRLDELDSAFLRLERAIALMALSHYDAIMPGYTHLQNAQPITFGHHLLAWIEALDRDRGRFADARRRLNECPLGSAALAGTPHPIDRRMTSRALGFDRPMRNSMDAVSARDFALEILAAAAIAGAGMSRIGEEIVLWCSPQFGFVRVSDAFSSGSSIMPQKRNPDAAELIRAKSGELFGALVAMLAVVKGLPLAYSKDLQEDKKPLFASLDVMATVLPALEGVIQSMTPDREAMRRAAALGGALATDLADWLVVRRDVPFREAHRIAGRIVAYAEKRGLPLEDVPLKDMQNIDSRISEDVMDVLSPEASAKARRSEGGTSPENVRREARAWRRRIARAQARARAE